MTLFTELEKYKNVKANTETTKRKNTASGITILDLKLYYRATVAKRACFVMVLAQNQMCSQWDRIEDSEIDTWIYGHIMSDKSVKIRWIKSNLFNKWSSQNWISTCRNMYLEPYLSHPYVNSKQAKYLKIQSVEQLEKKNPEKTFQDIGKDKNFLYRTPTI